MAYDLEVRPSEGAARDAVLAALRAALEARGGAPGAGEASVPLSSAGRATLALQAPAEGEPYLVVRVPYGAPAEEAGEALELAAAIASGLGYRVLDPQLGRAVAAADRPAVERRFEEASAWAVRYAGVSEDARSVGADTVIPKDPPRTQARLLLALAALLLLLLGAAELTARLWAPEDVPPPYADPPEAAP